MWRVDGQGDLQHGKGMAGWLEEIEAEAEAEEVEEVVEEEEATEVSSPHYYTITTPSDGQALSAILTQITGSPTAPFAPTSLTVYGRTVPIPRACDGLAHFTFAELCQTTLGPADYSTLASTFHTLILTDVPVLTWLMKNEARRFITLLDALYECRCKLYVSAAAGPDDIFFPDQKPDGRAGERQEGGDEDAVYAETFSEAYQDATAPFRPNILSQNPAYREPEPPPHPAMPAEPDYTHARLAGMLNADAIEDDPPNKPRSGGRSGFARSFGRTDAEMERAPVDPDEVRYAAPAAARRPDFGKASRFTGEDERFAYKRAQSRLWEMCGRKWWSRGRVEGEEEWHRPLPREMRGWEGSVESRSVPGVKVEEEVRVEVEGDVAMGGSMEDGTRDERSFKRQAQQQRKQESESLASASPFRNPEAAPPPKLDEAHVWSLGRWGKRAGAWGKGIEGLEERRREEREKEKGRG